MGAFRLLHCLTHSSLGGGQELVFTLTGTLLVRDPAVTTGVVLPAGGPYVNRFRSLGVEVHEAPLDSLTPAGAKAFRRAIAAFRPDIIHSHGKGAGLVSRTLSAGPCVHSYHGFFPPAGLLKRWLYFAAERHLLRRTAAVVAVSDAEADELRRVFPAHENKVTAIPNVIDRARVLSAALLPVPGEAAGFVSQHRDDILVTMVARDDPAKNYPLAAEACAHALAEDPRIAVLFVGAGDGPPVRLLRAGFPGRFHAVPRLDPVGPVMRASAMVLLTSVKEGGRPLVLQEALALGKPVVATDVPGIRETVRDGWNGILCPPDPKHVASAILRLARSEDERHVLGERAAADSAATDPALWAGRYHSLYDAVLEAAPALHP